MCSKLVVVLVFGSFVAVCPLLGTARAQDHPLIVPYEESKLFSKKTMEFDSYELRVGPLGKKDTIPVESIEGRLTRLEYRTPRERSALEVYRNYEAALLKAGFESLYACAGYGKGPTSCGDISGHYLAARLRRPEGDVYVALKIIGYQTLIVIVERKTMEGDKVRISAEALGEDIERAGHAAIYEILFDFDKAELKPESEPALAEIAKLLKERAELSVYVVGHTDSTGAVDHNLDLSRRRAAAVVAALAARHGVASSRMSSDGVGPLAPVASNRTEDGRARNRRVELVEQWSR
ncbi:MAG: OmpA family protein [Candidatus Schekmanbacteria bacterium]|nr:OmpA family protein [Candidatus Schekmanbacteria bacterium]